VSEPAVSPLIPAGVGDRRSAVLRSGLLAMVGLVALGGTRVIHGTLVSRATDKQTFAEVGTLIGLAMAASLFLPGGLSSAASKFIPFHRGKGDPAAARAAHRLLTLVGLGCAVGLGALVGAFAALVLHVSLSGAVAVALLTAVFSMYSVAKGALYGFDRVVPYTWLEIAGSVVALVATIAVVASGSHAYLAPLIIGYAVLMIGSVWVLRPRPHEQRLRLGVTDRREIAGYVGLASVGGLASAGLLQLLPLLAGWFTSADEVAYFAAGVTLVAPLYFLPRALGMALFPEMARAHGAGDVDTVRRHADISTRALLVLLAPVFAVGILVARDVMVLFFGTAYAPGAAVLQVLLAATYLSVIQVAAVNVLSSGTRREVRIPVFSAVAGSVVCLALLIPLGTWFGSAGVGTAYLIAVGFVATGPIVAAWRRYDMPWAHPLARSLVAVTVALAVALVVDATGMSGAGRVMLDVGLALAAVAGFGALLRGDILHVKRLAR
jgi:O-antigen/teichoic acid export membrane protein